MEKMKNMEEQTQASLDISHIQLDKVMKEFEDVSNEKNQLIQERE